MKSIRNSNLELLRILCILAIIGDHFTGQSGIVEWGGIGTNFFYCAVTSMSRVACSVFVIISAWFLVDKPFNIKKVIHIWLTVIMFTIPLTIYCRCIGLAGNRDLCKAVLPISGRLLWFASYYMVLILFTPALNYFLKEAPKKIHMWILLILFVLLVLFPSLTTEEGFFRDDLWVFLFLYLLTAYMKKYKSVPNHRKCLCLFIVLWFMLTLVRALVANNASASVWINLIRKYGEFYRSGIQTIPNIMMAYCLFFGFYGLKIRSSKIINFFAGKTLGVYCFHQVPMWYMYLWTNIFHAEKYAQLLHGYKRMFYVIISILLVWMLGVALETLRQKIAELLVEKREYYNKLCEKICGVLGG